LAETILEVKNLYMYYKVRDHAVKAVDNISLELNKGETLAIVGESGCGKSSLAISIFRLLPRNIYLFKGDIFVEGENIMRLDEEEFRKRIRWRKISMVFQGAMNSLNPVIKCGFQIAEPLIIHDGVDKEEALKIAKETLAMVGVHPSFADRYPFELSGGMRQRVVIAMALIKKPPIVILDEPTSALDVITQANIMNLLKRLKVELKLSYIFITHDIPLSSELADKVAVMYAGEVVERAPAEIFYGSPSHPYSAKLMASVPTLKTLKEIDFIPGAPPNLISPPPGCRFHPRCPYTMDICRIESPPEIYLQKDHMVRCWLYAKK